MKARSRRSRPQQHPDLDALGQITEQIAQPRRPIVARQPEIRRDVPAGDMHMRASAGQRLGDPWQRLPTVNQHLKRAPRARRGIGGSPQRWTARRIQLIDPANTLQPATMMPTDRGLEPLAYPAIHALKRHSGHDQSLRAVAGSRRVRPLVLELLVNADRPLEHRVGVLPLLANGLEHACRESI